MDRTELSAYSFGCAYSYGGFGKFLSIFVRVVCVLPNVRVVTQNRPMDDTANRPIALVYLTPSSQKTTCLHRIRVGRIPPFFGLEILGLLLDEKARKWQALNTKRYA